MIGLQYLFLEPNASDPLNKDAAIALQRDREKFKKSVQLSMQGRSIGGVEFDNVISASSRRR
jgi:ubiquitin-conjugating enzyme E2 M